MTRKIWAATAAFALLASGQAVAWQTPEAAPATFVCSDPRGDVRTVRGIYEALVEARRQCGEPSDDLSFL